MFIEQESTLEIRSRSWRGSYPLPIFFLLCCHDYVSEKWLGLGWPICICMGSMYQFFNLGQTPIVNQHRFSQICMWILIFFPFFLLILKSCNKGRLSGVWFDHVLCGTNFSTVLEGRFGKKCADRFTLSVQCQLLPTMHPTILKHIPLIGG